MTEIKSHLLLASVNAETGEVIYTFKWTYPRIILSEVNTHRMFSRNTSSSRAIPSKRQRKRVWEDPFTPVSIGAAKKGMQAGEELGGFKRSVATWVWNGARLPAILAASILDRLGVHKQVSNRLVEPWTWTEQLVSFTDADNFLNLRAHEAAEPHLQILAYQVKDQIEWVRNVIAALGPNYLKRLTHVTRNSDGSYLQVLKPGQWHLPFVNKNEEQELGIDLAKQVSAGRCARVSYNMPDTGKLATLNDCLRIYNQLIGGNPKHMSPVEHQATPMPGRWGNFNGWKQLRQYIEELDGKV